MAVTNTGVSPAFGVDPADMSSAAVNASSPSSGGGVNSPSPTRDGAASPAMTLVQPFSSWALDHIAFPKYDGVSKHTGVPSNFPDFASEHHIISLMRQVDLYLEPKYESYIDAAAGMPGPRRIDLSVET